MAPATSVSTRLLALLASQHIPGLFLSGAAAAAVDGGRALHGLLLQQQPASNPAASLSLASFHTAARRSNGAAASAAGGGESEGAAAGEREGHHSQHLERSPVTTQSRGSLLTCRLDSRAVVAFNGPDTIHFLQGLVTNDLSPYLERPPPITPALPTPNQSWAAYPPTYAMLLTPQGRVLFDLIFYKPSQQSSARLDATGGGPKLGKDDASQPSLYVDVAQDLVGEFLSHLKRHKLRANVRFEDATPSLSTWVAFRPVAPDTSASSSSPPPSEPGGGGAGGGGGTREGGGGAPAATEEQAGSIGWGGGLDVAGQAAAEADSEGWRWHSDPRLAELGLRGIFPAAATPPLVETDSMVSELEYRRWRLRNGVAEGPSEIARGEALPLEYNVDGLNGVSFDKGCYVGQELTARTHHRGVVRKRVMPVRFLFPDTLERDVGLGKAEVVIGGTGKAVGRVVAAEGEWGLAHLRLDPALKAAGEAEGSGTAAAAAAAAAADGGGGVKVELEAKSGGGDLRLSVWRPRWWPAAWGHEEEAA